MRKDCWMNAIMGEKNLVEVILIRLYSELKKKPFCLSNLDQGCVLTLLEIIKLVFNNEGCQDSKLID